MDERVAVLTGDIVGSTKISREHVEAAFQALMLADKHLRHDLDSADNPALERFRGDGWQALVRPAYALRATLLFAAAVRSVHPKLGTRISVGIGTSERLSSSGLGASDGEAFRLSGRGLESMKRSLFALAVPSQFVGGVWARSTFKLAGVLAQGWSRAQAEVLLVLLRPDPPTQSELGAQLGIAQQSVQDRFDNASGQTLLEVLSEYEGSNLA